jgi:purine-cytosine permease-like protein
MTINSILLPVIFIITSFILFFVAQKYFNNALYSDHLPFASSFSSAIGIIFSFLIGYAAISAWQGYKDIGAVIQKEAYTLNVI